LLEYLNSEEGTLVRAAREFARDRLLELDRNCDRNESSICSVLPQLAEMGFMALRLPEELGGLGCRRLLYAAILHELAYASPSASITLGVHNMVGEILLRFAGDRLKAELLPCWGRAESHAAFAISEADAGSDPAACSTIAVKQDRHWVINGSKMWVTSGHWGRWFAVLAQTRRVGEKAGLCMILVDGRQEGFERIHIRGKMGIRPSETFSLHLHQVRAPLDHLLGQEGAGLKLALTALDGGRIGVAAQSTGMAQACLDEMVSYARQRVQFGVPIARFQAVQNMIADSQVEIEAAKLLIARACHSADRGEDFTRAAAEAKLFASEIVGRVADRAVQVHGGTGYVNDSRVEQLYRDARVVRIYEGTSEIQRLVIARELLRESN
jgi:alkylation response protein AidB-like acyl-CoA dehydrogenase